MTDPGDFNSKIIAEFRENGGTVGGNFKTANLLLLHHTGARSGTERVSPVVYQPVGNGYAIFASKGGAPVHPAWYHNLVANPDTTIEVGGQKLKVRARVTGDAERGPIWEKQKQDAPQFAGYEEKAGEARKIPVILLDPVN